MRGYILPSSASGSKKEEKGKKEKKQGSHPPYWSQPERSKNKSKTKNKHKSHPPTYWPPLDSLQCVVRIFGLVFVGVLWVCFQNRYGMCCQSYKSRATTGGRPSQPPPAVTRLPGTGAKNHVKKKSPPG